MTLSGVAARTPDGRTLFHDLNLAFGRERSAIVGRNGAGKTTLARLIGGRVAPGEGAVTVNGRIGWLDQTPDWGPDQTVADVLDVAGPLARIARVLAGTGDAEDFERADWTLEARIDAVLSASGLRGLDLGRPMSGLSGGEATRLRLAALRLDAPDLLVLDEPTNHLDADGRAAVLDLIQTWPGGVVTVSHDRALLRRMDRIIELSSLGAAVHGGGWDLYVARRDAERNAAEQAVASAERGVDQAARDAQRALEKKARRDRAGKAFAMKGSEPRILLGAMAERAESSGARGSRLAERKAEAADATLDEARTRVERVRALDISMPTTGLAEGRTVLEFIDAAWQAPTGETILAPLSLKLTGPERVAVRGPNGAGKSTLLKLAGGRLAPTTGSVRRPVASAALDQDMKLLRADETLLEAWLRLNPEGDPNAAHAALARFLFRNAAAHRVVGGLSGGERLRAGLACVMTGPRPPQLLILDEPTNHLDLDSIEALEAALAGYDGALLVASHDADFIDAIGPTRTLDLVSPSSRPRRDGG